MTGLEVAIAAFVFNLGVPAGIAAWIGTIGSIITQVAGTMPCEGESVIVARNPD